MFPMLQVVAESILPPLLRAAWQAGWLAAGVWVVSLLCGRWLAPRWRFALWMVVFVRLAAPVLPSAPWSIFRLVALVDRPTIAVDAVDMPEIAPNAKRSPEATLGSNTRSSPRTEKETHAESRAEEPVSAPREQAEPERRFEWSWQSLVPWAFVVWLAGVAWLALRRVASVLALRKAGHAWSPIVDRGVLSLFDECREACGLSRPVRLLTAEGNVGPATCGVGQPRIVLPKKLLGRLTREQLRLVLMHELVHVARRDMLWEGLLAPLVMLHWFHPVGWVSRYFLRRERELACDAAVLGLCDGNAGAYGQAILSAIEALGTGPGSPLPAVGMFGRRRRSLIERRIRQIAAYRRAGWPGTLLGGCVLAAFLLVGLTDAQTAAPRPAVAEITSAAQEPDPSAASKQQRLAVLEQIYKVEKQLYSSARVSYAAFHAAQLELFTARREYAQTPQDRVKACEEALEDARESLAIAEQHRKAGHGTALAEMGAEAYLLETQLAVAGEAQEPSDASVADKSDEKAQPEIRYRAFSVSGRALDPAGQPIVGATIFLVSTNNSPGEVLGQATTDGEGRYRFKDANLPYYPPGDQETLEQGTFQVFGKAPGRGFAWCGMKFLFIDFGFKDANGKPLLVDPGQGFFPDDTIEQNLTFPPAKPVQGRFVDGEGKPIAGVKVVVTDCDYTAAAGHEANEAYREFGHAVQLADDAMPEQMRSVSDAEGRFELRSVPEGIVCRLSMRHPEYGTWAVYTTTGDPAAVKGNDRYSDAPLVESPIEMTRRGVQNVTIEVRYADTLEPVAGAMVGAYLKLGTNNSWGETDAEGKVRLRLFPGEFTVWVHPKKGSDYLTAEAELAVGSTDAPRTLEVKLPRATVLVLKAVDAATGKGIEGVEFWYEDDEQSGKKWS
ncbi:MAG TPA: M56 family metallopeptidase, partial [Pirellulales bacterium]|nr:M56 family metallopeptidase [Pirellulales bacterium]